MFYVNKWILIAFCQADAERNALQLVYFDLETTYATNDIQICQITCIGPDESTYKCIYSSTNSCIPPHITSITMLMKVLLYYDQPVVTVDEVDEVIDKQ